MKNKRYSKVCIADAVYVLFFYLLYSSEEEVEETFFFFGDGIDKNIRSHFRNSAHIRSPKNICRKTCLRIYLHFFSYFKWPYLKTAEIIGQDHIYFAPSLIRKRDYTLIEDAPLFFSFFYMSNLYQKIKKKREGLKGRLGRVFCGNILFKWAGDNDQCKEILLSKKSSSPLLEGKKVTVLDLEYLWKNASNGKKIWLKSIFDLNNTDEISGKSIIIFTQPFSTDGLISESEQVNVFREIVNEYPEEDILLKTHPRDSIDYQKYFPTLSIFDKPIPMQFFDILGVRFKKAVTICSSSVLSFPYEIEVDWLGTSRFPALYAVLGEKKKPIE